MISAKGFRIAGKRARDWDKRAECSICVWDEPRQACDLASEVAIEAWDLEHG